MGGQEMGPRGIQTHQWYLWRVVRMESASGAPTAVSWCLASWLQLLGTVRIGMRQMRPENLASNV